MTKKEAQNILPQDLVHEERFELWPLNKSFKNLY